MIQSGLVSITFRALSPEAVVRLCAHAGLRGLEWGGDVHVPHGDLRQAATVRALTADAGLTVAAYGSYYRAGSPPGPDHPAFSAVLDTAMALGAPSIRVWAGACGSEQAARQGCRARVVDDLARVSTAAAAVGVGVVLEHHGGTLTDTLSSCTALLGELPHPNVRFGWQPLPAGTEAAQRLNLLRPRLGPLHVFWWTCDAQGYPVRHPLATGVRAWTRYLTWAGGAPGSRFAMLEYVRGDDPAQCLHDAAILNGLLKAAGGDTVRA